MEVKKRIRRYYTRLTKIVEAIIYKGQLCPISSATVTVDVYIIHSNKDNQRTCIYHIFKTTKDMRQLASHLFSDLQRQDNISTILASPDNDIIQCI